MQCLLGGFKIKEGIKIFLVLLVFAIAITAYAIYASDGVAWCKTDVDTSGTITTRT